MSSRKKKKTGLGIRTTHFAKIGVCNHIGFLETYMYEPKENEHYGSYAGKWDKMYEYAKKYFDLSIIFHVNGKVEDFGIEPITLDNCGGRDKKDEIILGFTAPLYVKNDNTKNNEKIKYIWLNINMGILFKCKRIENKLKELYLTLKKQYVDTGKYKGIQINLCDKFHFEIIPYGELSERVKTEKKFKYKDIMDFI